MKRLIPLLLLLLPAFALQAQNLVPNPGFEEYVGDSVSYWEQPKGMFYHFEHNSSRAHTGNCLNGICLWRNEISEYMEVKLSEPLLAGKRYLVRAYTVINSPDPIKYPADSLLHIGIYFSKDKFEVTKKKYLFFKPHINLSVYKDSLWCKTEGIYVASGGERYLIMGHFFELAEQQQQEQLRQQMDTVNDRILSSIEDLNLQKQKAIQEAIAVIDEKYKPIQAESWNIGKEMSQRKQEKLIKEFKASMLDKQNEINQKSREISNTFDEQISAIYQKYNMSLAMTRGYPGFRTYFDDISVTAAPDVVVEKRIIPLRNVFFNTGESLLLPASYTELDKQLDYLNKNTAIRIE
ncbi:MAG: hypothetical protein WCL06_09845, partial [Bacteroidota bacterium]